MFGPEEQGRKLLPNQFFAFSEEVLEPFKVP
jgi:hypothetical protein